MTIATSDGVTPIHFYVFQYNGILNGELTTSVEIEKFLWYQSKNGDEILDSMLYLKKINLEDVEEEYKAIKSIPAQENGFENKYHNVTKEELVNEVIPKLLKKSEGLDLPDGYVPDTYFFLWDDNKIVGLFKAKTLLK